MKIECAHDAVVRLKDLKPHPGNPNKHPPEQIRLLAKIIAGQGWRLPIVVSKRSGFIVAGHGRLLAAQALKLKEAPVDYQEFGSEAEEIAHLIADNRIAELAEMDRSALRELAEQIDSGAFDMDLTGFDEAALEELMTATPPGSDMDAEPQIDKAEELRKKWGVERGQIWELGEHRLMCGDATKKLDVEAVCSGTRPLLMVTDPPYGVNLDQSWRDDALGIKAMGPGNNKKVTNDSQCDWTEAWDLFKGDIAYVWHASRFSDVVMSSLRSCGLEPCQQLIWNKTIMVMGRSDYHFKHEPCWYAVRKGANHRWVGDRKQTTVIDAASPNHIMAGSKEEKTSHPTQKPVDCFRVIRNHSGEEVYDPFVGSGTTIIACEQLNRKCRAMEIDPGYVAVSIQRWADATGKTPRLINGR